MAALLPSAREALAAAEELARITRAGLHAGSCTLLVVQEEEAALVTARRQLAELLIDVRRSEIDLLAAIGELRTEYLIEP